MICESNVFKNSSFCDYVFKHHEFDLYMLQYTQAKDYITYLLKKDPSAVPGVYSQLDENVQMQLVKEIKMPQEILGDVLTGSKKSAAEYIMNTDGRSTLEDITLYQLSRMAERCITFPHRLLKGKLVDNIVQMDDINSYRILIEKMAAYNDVSFLEAKRKKYYEQELAGIDEEGLLPEYAALKTDFINGMPINIALKKNIPGFGDNEHIIRILFRTNLQDSEDINRAIHCLNDYRISNIIIDYLFENIPSNTITDINQMLQFQKSQATISAEQRDIYNFLASIDKLSTDKKIKMFEQLKNLNLKEQFYDDYEGTKQQMVASINASLLNEASLPSFLDKDLTSACGVNVYVLKGQPFYALVRCWGQSKNDVLRDDQVEFREDGASFSIDGSGLLATFHDPREDYHILYNGIPEKQLIHLFPLDSYSKYIRTSNRTPDGGLGTTRIFNMLSIEELTTLGKEHTEVLISVPDAMRMDNEFEQQLKEPKKLAIYCYDYATPEDIESAKKLGIGIVIVDTSQYKIDKTDRLSQYDTINQSIYGKNKYDYLYKNSDRDTRLTDR